jgi:hypothetical protein
MVFGAGEATEAVPRRWIDIAQAVLKLAIKVAPQKLKSPAAHPPTLTIGSFSRRGGEA